MSKSEMSKSNKSKKKHFFLLVPVAVIIILLVAVLIPTLRNQNNNTYQDLSEVDRAVLKELNDYLCAEKQTPVWEGFDLSEQPILAINKESGQAFLVNPTQAVRSIFAKEIVLPQEFTIQVYRISASAPQLLRFVFSGNFNIIGMNYSVWGNNVFFTKYDTSSISALQNSQHYITFLTHESFHNSMQTNWPESGRFDTSVLTDKDLALMEAEYAVLGRIYEALPQPEKSELVALTVEYVAAVSRRIAENPQYMQEELQAETCEGTATYVGIHASKLAGYDYRIMHIDASSAGMGVIEWPFDTVVPLIREGALAKDAIASDLVYETGGLLCELLDALEIPDWQQRLNSQTKEAPVTLYSLLAEYVQTQ